MRLSRGCARAASDHALALLRRVMNSRRLLVIPISPSTAVISAHGTITHVHQSVCARQVQEPVQVRGRKFWRAQAKKLRNDSCGAFLFVGLGGAYIVQNVTLRSLSLVSLSERLASMPAFRAA